jgi:hypothetical protein
MLPTYQFQSLFSGISCEQRIIKQTAMPGVSHYIIPDFNMNG